MKKYTLAAVLAAVAFAGVSFVAQAADPAPGTAMTAPAKEVSAADKAKADCEIAAAAKKADGTEPTAEEKAASVKKCLEKPAEAPKVEEKKEEKK